MKTAQHLKLTEQSLVKLRRENLPLDILTELEELKNQEFPTEKKLFQAIRKKIGKNVTAQYKMLILKHLDTVEHAQKSVFREYTEAFVIAIILAMIIRIFIVEAFKIPSGSMIPTLLIGDHLLVNKFIYRFKEPERRDIVVFKYPDNPSRNFIKRIIGVGGDTIEVRDKVVYVNGMPQEEPYTQHISPEILPAQYARDNFGPITVPANSYFMMGDNRDSSLDSRFWQNKFVTRQALVGKAFIIYWSWNRDEEQLPHEHEAFLDTVLRHATTIVYYITHLPSSVRWRRIGQLIR